MHWLKKLRTPFLRDWYSLDGRWYFLMIVLLYLILLVLKRLFIIDTIAAFEVLQSRGEMWLFDLFFGLQYVAVPLFLLWKFTWTTLLLWIGCFLFGYRITFFQLWKLVNVLELVFVVPELLKVVWFVSSSTDSSYHEYLAFYPLSLMNLFDYESLADQWRYPLKSLNLFEGVYWGWLVAGIYWLSNKSLKTSSLIVFTTYVPFYLLWLGYYLLVYR